MPKLEISLKQAAVVCVLLCLATGHARELNPSQFQIHIAESDNYDGDMRGRHGGVEMESPRMVGLKGSNGGDSTTTIGLKVMQYNVFLRPTSVASDGQHERMLQIAPTIASYPELRDVDVITFCELDDDDNAAVVEQHLSNSLGGNWTVSHAPESKPIHDGKITFVNGGIRIATKHKVHALRQYVYEHTSKIWHQADELAAKGSIYARIEKEGKIFNVFATHMQAWYDEDSVKARAQQAVELKNFIDMQLFAVNGKVTRIPSWEPVIIAGDFNDDLVFHPQDALGMLKTLEVAHPSSYMFTNQHGQSLSQQQLNDPSTQLFTSDPSSNILVGADGACGGDSTFKVPSCKTQYVECISSNKACTGCNTALEYYKEPSCPLCPSDPTNPQSFFYVNNTLRQQTNHNLNGCYCPCCPHEWLDYILYKPANKVPSVVNLTAIVFKAPEPFDVKLEGVQQKIRDVSDHYPVLSHMEFTYDSSTPEPVVELLGAETSNAEGLNEGTPTCKAKWYAPTCECRNCNSYGTSCDLDNTCQYVGVPGLGGKCEAGFTTSYNINNCLSSQ